MLSINRQKDENGTLCLRLGGEATIQNAAMFREVLITAIREEKSIRLSLAQVSEMDLTFFQLFCSAHRSAVAANIPICLDDEMPASITEVLRTFGFERHQGCAQSSDPSSCIWIKEIS